MASNPNIKLSANQHDIVTAAVRAAEQTTDGEVVTIVAEKSDGYSDVAYAWAAAAALFALMALAVAPGFFLDKYDWVMGNWTTDRSAGRLFAIAASVAALKFAGMALIQLWPPLRFFMVPPPIKSARVRGRAVALFKVGAEKRTVGLTGVLVYLSMREKRAEIIADASIAEKVSPEVWGDAMAALLAEVQQGRIGEGIAEAVRQVGIILSEHFPKSDNNPNEIPDRLIEL